MRALARRVTQLWGERREEQGFPLGRVQQPEDAVAGAPTPEHMPAKGGVAPFVLEIGSEELPPADVEAAMAQLRAAVPEMLEELKLEHGGVTVEGTPRRLVVMVDSLAAFTKVSESVCPLWCLILSILRFFYLAFEVSSVKTK
jgi:glycyl-tRNA synthetase